MKLVDLLKWDLHTQYLTFRAVMYVDLTISCLCAAAGSFGWGFGLLIVGLVLGGIGNDKLSLLNQQRVLNNQLRIEDKLDVLLEGK